MNCRNHGGNRVMVKRVMKQRVAVALVCGTVWLTSIVGASVPSGETTGFPNLRPSGPSPDQYTPLFRNPLDYEPEDDHGRGWMSDPDPGMNAPNGRDESPPNYELSNGKESGAVSDADEYRINEFDSAEEQRLSTIKVAFDDPIDGSERGEEEDADADAVYWSRDGGREGGDMQRDVFLGDDTFEDEGPGSVEVYKLDLFGDAPVLNPRPARRNGHQRTKSKAPKKANWKSAPTMTTTTTTTTTTTRKSGTPKEFEEPKSIQKKAKRLGEIPPLSSRSLKERIFGTGGVPELQVGCEGVEGSEQQRQKRSGPVNKGEHSRPSPPVYTDVDYDLDDYYDLIAGPEDPRYPGKSSRGDMNPKVKTPADIEARKILLKGQMPKRGDLGAAWEESLSRADRFAGKKELRAKRSPIPRSRNNYDIGESPVRSKDHVKPRRRHRRGKRYEGEKKAHKMSHFRGADQPRRRNIDAFQTGMEDEIGLDAKRFANNRKAEAEESSTLDRPAAVNPKSEKSRRIRDENARKLADYIRRNTPIKLPRNPAKKYEANDVPAALTHQDPWRYADAYAIRRHEVLEQKQPVTEVINRSTFEEEQRRRGGSNEVSPEKDLLHDEVIFNGRTRKEIERLKSLPVQSLIVIESRNSTSNEVPPIVESRFGDEVSPTSTSSLLATGPSPCVWAIINCCSNKKRLTACFEAKGCPGGHWDDPCTTEKMSSAVQTVTQYYIH